MTPPISPAVGDEAFLGAEARAEAWSDRVEIKEMVDVTSVVFAKWASPELMSRFRQQMMAVIQQAFIEGVSAESDRIKELEALVEEARELALPTAGAIEAVLRDKIHRTSRLYSVRTGERRYGVGGYTDAANAVRALLQVRQASRALDKGKP